ncbi:MAG: preprotein translocase subunit Sec61beta [Nitrososphaerota archaeon]
MSRRKRKEAPIPSSAAGLLRFFEEETKGFKIPPIIIIVLSFILMAIVLILQRIAPI